MPFGFVTSTGNSLLNPLATSTWVPDFSFWGVNFNPSNQASWLGLADYAYATLINTAGSLSNPLARLGSGAVGQAALAQRAALGTQGVDLTMLGRRLSEGTIKKTVPSGTLFSRAAAPLYFAQTLGGSTPTPVQAQQMISKPFTPAPVTAFLENLLGVSPTAVATPQQPAALDRHEAARLQRNKPIYRGSQGGSRPRRMV